MSALQKGQNTSVDTGVLTATVRRASGPVGVDLSALLLTSSGTVRSDDDFVFYNQPEHGSGAVRHVPGTAGSGDAVAVDLARVEPAVERVVVALSADGGTVGQVEDLRLVVTGDGQSPVAEFAMSAGSETAFVAGEFYRRDAGWKFRAVGQGWADGLAGLARDFGISVDDDAPQPPAANQAPPTAAASPTPPPAVSLKKQQLVDMEKRVAEQAPQLLSLTKTAAVSLEKRGLGEHTAKVALCLDISGSMWSLYKSGKVQQLAERVLALGLRFDDDGEVDIFLFGAKAYQDPPLTLDNHRGYVDSMTKLHKLEAGTKYGRAMELVRQHYFGSSDRRKKPLTRDVPVYIMFVTDGASTDEDVTVTQLKSSSYEPVFWQFMAIGRPGSREFDFLQRLDDLRGRHLDNADFFAVEDPATVSDDALFDQLMTEYPAWLAQARQKGLLPPGDGLR